MTQSGYSVLVFDLDGTLVDTMDDYADMAAQLMETHFGTPRQQARSDYFATSGLPFEQQLRQLYPARPAQQTGAVAEAFETWKDGYLAAVSLPDAVAALFAQWRAEGFKIAISSNNMEVYVDRLARDWPVDHALGYRPQDGFGKGEAHFAALEARLDTPRSQFLFTGDSPNDARIAAACGVAFRALLTGAFVAGDFRRIDPDIVLLTSLCGLPSTF